MNRSATPETISPSWYVFSGSPGGTSPILLLAMGRDGGYIFAPAHDVEGDVPLGNMLAFIEIAQEQPAYRQ
ncbi:MAG TPA: hypothetical protein VMV68_06825 [Spirochaetia bacterium]|nr:hypothetical protein [Spirochaetia bacterium]